MKMAEAVAEEYRSSLCDLNFNSKPHINMLTMLAEENVKFAPVIVKTIVSHIATVPSNLKLPSLYLVDSIMKNIGGQYIALFCDHMITLFSTVFEKVEETTRSSLYKLRQTWNDILPKKILYGIDCNVNHIDPAWPITAKIPPPSPKAAAAAPPKSPIHVNPKFLGTPTTQASNPTRNPTIAKKTEIGMKDKEKEVMEIKKKQEEMLRLIEEKKEQLKALEQKKMEMAAKQKKKSPNMVSILAQQNAQKKPVNHRDPRLKKVNSVPPAVSDKPSSNALQSVVVVPNTKLPVNDAMSNNGNIKSLHKPILKNEKPNVANKTFHSGETTESGNRRTDELPKKSPKGADNGKASEKPIKNIHNTNREHLNRTSKTVNKKHSLNPEEKMGPNAKRFCKPTVNKSKRPISSKGDFEDESHTKNVMFKKGKHESIRSKNKMDGSKRLGYDNEVLPGAEQSLEPPIMFGIKDTDYRQINQPSVNINSKKWHKPEVVPHPSARISQEPFYPMEHKHDVLQNEPSENFYPHESMPPVGRRVPDVNYPSPRTDFDQDLIESDKFSHQEHAHMKLIDSSIIKKEPPDQNYPMAPIPAPNMLSPTPFQFTLDGVNYTVYFINEHAFTASNNEPKEAIFQGPPRNIHIEGLPHPILLGFDGRTIEFETEGKLNNIRFGTPLREVYINNIPHKANFGGAPFPVVLEDNKMHRVRVDGPPPQVILSKLSEELYDMCHSRGILSLLGVDQGGVPKSSESSVLLHDVDMRVKPSHNIKSSILPEVQKDVDYRVLPTAAPPQVPWDVPKNNFERFPEYDSPGSGRNFQELPNSSLASNVPTQWNDGNNRIRGDLIGPERNNDMVRGPWPRPGFRPLMQLVERPRFEPPRVPNQRPPCGPGWEMQSTLPPPPRIPPSLSNLPNLNVPPPTWNPLPPPPRFPGQVPEQTTLPSTVLAPVSSSSNMVQNGSVSTVPALSINVETIYDKLVAAGIIPKKTESEKPKVATVEDTKEEKESEDQETEVKEEVPAPEINFSPKSLKTYHPHVISALYKGSQCATCGMRFKEIQSEQYSRHLDWHFRMNRREKDGAKKAYSRRWFYEIKDWIQFKEIEEAEERTPSYFELQADGDASRSEEKEKVQSVPASECESEKCSVCGEAFQLFWVEEEEEWHLRHAVRHDGEAYHPMCYEDFKKAEEMANREPEPEEKTEEPDPSVDIKEEKDEDETTKVEPGEKKTEDEIKKEETPDTEQGEDGVTIKKEPEDTPEEEAKEEKPMEVEEPVPPKPVIDSLLSSDVDSDNFEDDFRPPTPDPRFNILPPVEKGKELSALCTIM